jgi:hypothetical protein
MGGSEARDGQDFHFVTCALIVNNHCQPRIRAAQYCDEMVAHARPRQEPWCRAPQTRDREPVS